MNISTDEYHSIFLGILYELKKTFPFLWKTAPRFHIKEWSSGSRKIWYDLHKSRYHLTGFGLQKTSLQDTWTEEAMIVISLWGPLNSSSSQPHWVSPKILPSLRKGSLWYLVSNTITWRYIILSHSIQKQETICEVFFFLTLTLLLGGPNV